MTKEEKEYIKKEEEKENECWLCGGIRVIGGKHCLTCANYFHSCPTDHACKAFPYFEGIPDDLWYDRIKHVTPYPGDHGVQYEEITD